MFAFVQFRTNDRARPAVRARRSASRRSRSPTAPCDGRRRGRPAGGRGGPPPRPLPLVRQRRHGAREGERRGTASRGGCAAGIGLTVGDAGDERARPAAAGRRAWGRSARSGSCPTSTRSACCRTRRTPARCSSTTSRSTASRRRVCQRSFLKRMAARLAERGAVLRGRRSRTSSRSRREVDGAYVPVDSGALLLDDRR